MIGSRPWANWRRYLGDILGLAALVVGAEVFGIRFYRDAQSNWLLWIVVPLVLASSHWSWRTQSPKDDEVAKTNQYRTYALVMAIGRIFGSPWLAWYATGDAQKPAGLSIILVVVYTQWARHLYKAAKKDMLLVD